MLPFSCCVTDLSTQVRGERKKMLRWRKDGTSVLKSWGNAQMCAWHDHQEPALTSFCTCKATIYYTIVHLPMLRSIRNCVLLNLSPFQGRLRRKKGILFLPICANGCSVPPTMCEAEGVRGSRYSRLKACEAECVGS